LKPVCPLHKHLEKIPKQLQNANNSTIQHV
jgi:hypothetical protein